ncbi:tRNA pseudouridine(55) synthase TruB [Kyrpidia spormannii]|uniref:tRNA pseudouridine synthase B n=1 Tax=Kyrpidia spormannii TaxID=2055160 RepID=A0A6F9EAA4_9BACL|nr:tRNA pseudouridine(55) synthase TruB [Kyrpidia spormannii]CAB3393346.1 tRNA pseudouridine synthase B [Kyrpidia spormannii]
MNGVLVLDKPAGLTSHDVVGRVRRWLGIRRIGHTGTLDPDATGVLVLCVGKATRIAEYLSGEDKEYIGVLALGAATDTDDASGEVIERMPNPPADPEALRRAAAALTGEILQRPPAFSAVRVGGKRAYDLARAGRPADLPARKVQVYRFDVGMPTPRGELLEAPFHVACSKGTYVRSLCRDLGAKVGIPAHMASLRRVRQGPFTVEQALPWSEVQRGGEEGRLAEAVRPMLWALRTWPRFTLLAGEVDRLRQGRELMADLARLSPGTSPPGLLVAAYQDQLVAVCRRNGERIFPLKVLLT